MSEPSQNPSAGDASADASTNETVASVAEPLAPVPGDTPPPPPLPPPPAPASTGSASIPSDRPEVAVGAAFAGGLVFALILKRLAR